VQTARNTLLIFLIWLIAGKPGKVAGNKTFVVTDKYNGSIPNICSPRGNMYSSTAVPDDDDDDIYFKKITMRQAVTKSIFMLIRNQLERHKYKMELIRKKYS
jgi:hypothetical protein